MKVFEATIKISGSGIRKTQISAADLFAARQLLESQYGKGSVLTLIAAKE